MTNIKRAFNRAANTYDDSMLQQKIGGTLLQFVEKLNLPNPIRVIDLGCGTGLVTEKLAQLFPNQEIHAIDIADQLLQLAKKRLGHTTIKIDEADYHSLSYKNYFDLVFSNMALQWSENICETLKKINGYLTKKSALAFSVPLPGTLNELNNQFEILPFTSQKIIETTLMDLGFNFTSHVESITLSFDNTLLALKCIKNMGANQVLKRTQKHLSKKINFNHFHISKLTFIIAYFMAEKNEK
ncbi:MAG: hypothetical protein A3F12_05400 [Gammaproteobacteria bacterium RIFCSPHIGHO2_12_FULL_38_14]|nr:MAG: hypothetical protein A3F12_05400 [Gammaproteobacteria bacterium RIFCSPHIGHO2_12_FULL_38_14]